MIAAKMMFVIFGGQSTNLGARPPELRAWYNCSNVYKILPYLLFYSVGHDKCATWFL